MAAEYRVVCREADRTNGFEPSTVIAEFENAKNIGIGEYLNDVGESFFTLNQGDPKTERLTDALMNKAIHTQIFRNGDQMFGGWIGDTDENETDVILYSYSYASALFFLMTEWNQTFEGEQVDAIVGDLWSLAQTKGDSLLAWLTTGSIQAPVTTSGGSTAIVMPEYSANYKRILFALQELAGMGASDTTNRVAFEITPTGTFNFWKDKGTTRTDRVLEYGGNVLGYHRIRTPMDRRNVILGVGSSPRDIILLRTAQNVTDRNFNGRREEPLFFSWVRDQDEMDRVASLRLTRALRVDNNLALSTHPNSVVPARATGSDFEIGDYIPVRIENGITQVSGNKLVTGQQIVARRGVELVRPIVQDSL